MQGMTSEEMADRVRQLFFEACRPFPYADCAKIAKLGCIQYEICEGFIPTLDHFASTIAGYCSRGRKILALPKEELQSIRAEVSQSFFEKYPVDK